MDSLEIFRLILNVFELAAAITGFIYWYKIKNSYWKWFPFLLSFLFITEMTAKFIRWEGSYKTTVPLLYKYINIPAMFIVLIWLMGKELKDTKWKKLPFELITIYLLNFIAETLFFDAAFSRFGSLSYQTGCIAILILAIFCFNKLVTDKEIIHFKRSLHFWVSLGVVSYLVTTVPYMAFRNSLFKFNYELGVSLWYVTMFLNFIMYSCFIIGFILYKPELTPQHAKN